MERLYTHRNGRTHRTSERFSRATGATRPVAALRRPLAHRSNVSLSQARRELRGDDRLAPAAARHGLAVTRPG